MSEHTGSIGWICQKCGTFVPPNVYHVCGGYNPAPTLEVTEDKRLDTIIELLQQILHELRRK